MKHSIALSNFDFGNIHRKIFGCIAQAGRRAGARAGGHRRPASLPAGRLAGFGKGQVIYTHIHRSLSLSVYIYIYICISVYMYVCIYIYIYIHMYVCIFLDNLSSHSCSCPSRCLLKMCGLYLGKGQLWSALMGSLQISCLMTGTFWALPLAYCYLPRSARAHLFPQSVEIHYFCSGPISVDPICPQPTLGDCAFRVLRASAAALNKP